jgi:signal transduction histidine kinase
MTQNATNNLSDQNSNKLVLIVEDDPSFAKLVELRLKNWDPAIKFIIANTLAKASAELSKDQQFYFVILDQHLPDGIGASLFSHPKLQETTVLAMSSDNSPEVPARAVRAGAQHFLGKKQLSEPLFIPLLEALLERKDLERQVLSSRLKESRMKTIKMLLATLQHEINNPLGAVFGATYIIRAGGSLSEDQKQALQLLESSSERIKHVVLQLCEAAELEEVLKAKESVFHIPGDPAWNKK